MTLMCRVICQEGLKRLPKLSDLSQRCNISTSISIHHFADDRVVRTPTDAILQEIQRVHPEVVTNNVE